MTDAGRDPFAHYRRELAAMGFRPSSARGQNFLLDPSLHRWIADAAAPAADDTVLEIGTGLGFLTRELAPRCARLIGVEVDRRLWSLGSRELAAHANVTLLCADALGGPDGQLHPDVVAAVSARAPGAAFVVVANLPYAVSGPLLAELTCLAEPPQRAVVLVQKELGDRVAAGAATADYGGLSALVQSVFAVRQLRVVPPDVFRPRPKVASVVLRLDRHAQLALPAAVQRREFARFLRRLFQQRRKTLRSTLPPAAAAAGGALPADLPPALLARRAEELDTGNLLDLWRQVAGRAVRTADPTDARPAR